MNEALARDLLQLAKRSGIRVAVAESLTGGLLADAIVMVPGASSVFSGGVIAYDTSLKATLLGVDEGVLAAKGPVCEEVVLAMARGVRDRCAVTRDGVFEPAHLGIATTGVAGPDPDPQTGQAPGTVWVGVSLGAEAWAQRVQLAGDRAEVRAGAVGAALSFTLLNLSQHGASL